MPEETLYILGPIGIIFIFAIKEFFSWLKSRKNGTSKTSEDILKELQLMNTNHLNSICKTIDDGNDRIVEAVNSMEKNLGAKLDRLIGRSDKL